MKTLVMLATFAIVSAITQTSVAAGTKVPQYAYSLDLRERAEFNPETGEKEKGVPANKLELLRSAGTISSVQFYKHDNTQLRISVDGGNLTRSTIFLMFKQADSARILKEALTNGDKSLVLLVDFFDHEVKMERSFLNVSASAAYVWDDETQSITAIGNLIGPKRSLHEQDMFDQIMTWIFGRAYLNKVNFNETGVSQRLKEI